MTERTAIFNHPQERKPSFRLALCAVFLAVAVIGLGAFTRLAAIPDVRIEDMNSCMQVAAGSHCLAATLKSTATGE